MIALQDAPTLFGRTGSFWTSGLSAAASAQARRLVETTQQNKLSDTLRETLVRLATLDEAPISHGRLQVAADQVSQTATTPSPRWEMTITEELEPIAIRTKLGLRLQGVDFLYAPGVLTWFESPHQLFDFPAIEVVTSRPLRRSLWNYPLQAEAPVGDPSEITRYYRVRQDPLQLQRATAAAAGYTVLPFDSILRSVENGRYVFDAGQVTADYAHTPLEVGRYYAAGTVIGDMVKVYTASLQGTNWHRTLDWSEGLSLDELSPFRGLSVPDAQRRIATDVESSAHPGKYHVTAQLDLREQSGRALIPSGQTVVTVRFLKPFAELPLVAGSPQAGSGEELPAVAFTLFDVNVFGFTLALSSPAGEPFYFNWKAGLPDTDHGQTAVPPGSDRIRVNFAAPRETVPVIMGCLQTENSAELEVLFHVVSRPDETGFDVLFSYPTTYPMLFNWQAETPRTEISRELIPADTDTLEITFTEEHERAPLILHSLQNMSETTAEIIPYAITQVTTTGFTVKLSSPVSTDCFFNWSAIVDYQDVHTRFWNHQATMEDITGVFLADAIGLAPNTSTGVNLLDLYFQYLLGPKGLVVELKRTVDNTAEVARAERFLRREKPLGAALILRYL